MSTDRPHDNTVSVEMIAMMAEARQRPFRTGDAVVFEPKNLNPEWWGKQSEADRVTWYGPLGYGDPRPHVWVFITEVSGAPGHCVLISLRNQSTQTMRHTSDFRFATEDEL